MRVLRFRWFNKMYAKLRGYFWLPCPRCGQEFGGHEKGWGLPKHWLISGHFRGMCPECVSISEEEQNPHNDKYWQVQLLRTEPCEAGIVNRDQDYPDVKHEV